MSNLLRDKDNNQSGIFLLLYQEIAHIVSIPAEVDCNIPTTVILEDGTSWNYVEMSVDDRGFQIQEKTSDAGTLHLVTVTGFLAGETNWSLKEKSRLKVLKLNAIVLDNDGNKRYLGDLDTPFRFSFPEFNTENDIKKGRKGTKVVLYGEMTYPPYFYQGAFSVLVNDNPAPPTGDFSTLYNMIIADRVRLTALESGKVDKITGKGLSQNDFTNALKTAYDAAVIQVGTLTTDLDAVETDITNINDDISVINATLTDLQDNDTLHGEQIVSLQEQIDTHTTEIGDLNTDITNVNADIAEVNASITDSLKQCTITNTTFTAARKVTVDFPFDENPNLTLLCEAIPNRKWYLTFTSSLVPIIDFLGLTDFVEGSKYTIYIVKGFSADLTIQLDSSLDGIVAIRDLDNQGATIPSFVFSGTTGSRFAIELTVRQGSGIVEYLAQEIGWFTKDEQAALDASIESINDTLALKADLVDGKVPSSQLPSYVDDVLEFANLAAFPGTGETGKIYVALDTNRAYRWGGSSYIEIVASPGSTDALAEGSTNLYFTVARVLSSVIGSLSGLVVNTAISATDTVKIALGKLQGQVDAINTANTGDETAARIGALINGSAAATPNDSDLVATADGSVLKKISWASVKSFFWAVISGHITINSSGVATIGANVVALTNIFQTATRRLLGRISASTGNHESLTIDQVWELLTNPTNNTSSGTLNDVSTSDLNYLRFTLAPTITGFANGARGKVLFIFNDHATSSITLNHQNAGSVAANRIIIGLGQPVTIPAQTIAMLLYSPTLTRWIIQGIFGNTYFPTLSGTGSRGLQTDANGNVSPVVYQSIVTGNITLVAGVGTATISGASGTSEAILTVKTPGGTMGAKLKYSFSGTTLTVTATDLSDATVTTDTSIIHYLVEV